ncbi:MAG: SDR family NAD(P)-dependent oxidoreductase, partial [Erysipelotrichaceae bacterium]|nr:SDR family NAD(P)-dependent oxidoreductase [Erysipelotrichaceae bacterium]
MNSIQNLFSLAGKTAIVTGANTGLGQGISVALAAAGAHVFGVARRSCEETLNKVNEIGGQFTEVIADLSDLSAIEKIMTEVKSKTERIDILVNNAGIIKRADAIDVTVEEWDQVIDLNQKLVFFLSQAVAKDWIADKKGGKIINICSMLSYQGGIRVP